MIGHCLGRMVKEWEMLVQLMKLCLMNGIAGWPAWRACTSSGITSSSESDTSWSSQAPMPMALDGRNMRYIYTSCSIPYAQGCDLSCTYSNDRSHYCTFMIGHCLGRMVIYTVAGTKRVPAASIYHPCAQGCDLSCTYSNVHSYIHLLRHRLSIPVTAIGYI